MKKIIFLLLSGIIFSQSRVGEMRSITSSLKVRDIIFFENEIFLATEGGLASYNPISEEYKVFTSDDGLIDTDIYSINIGPMENIWIGSNKCIQVWNPKNQSIVDWFELDIEKVTGFSNYKGMVYSSTKQNGVWGITEFIFSNGKIYYRDFYSRNDIQNISNIITVGDKIILHVGKTLIAGNPHKEHLVNWINPYSNLNGEVKAINVNDGNLAVISSNTAYSIDNGNLLKVLITDNNNLSLINHVEVIDPQYFIAISDSILFSITLDKIEKKYSNSLLRFSSIVDYSSEFWLGSEIGFGKIKDEEFEFIARNQSYVNSSDVILLAETDKYIIANNKGISLSGWSNLSVKNYLDQDLDKLKLKNISLDLGNYFSEIVLLDSIVYMGMYYSSSAGIASFDISNELKFKNSLITNKDMSLNGFHFFVPDITLDRKNNLWAISKNNKMKPITVIKDDQTRYLSIEESNYLLSNDSNTLTVDNFNRLWIGSPDGLIMYKYEGDIMNPTGEIWLKENIDPGVVNRIPLDISISKKNRMWILTSIGLIYKDLQVSESEPVIKTGPISGQNDLNPYFPSILFNDRSKIRFDPRGNIWLTTHSNGVFVLTADGEYWPDINGLNTSNSNLLSDHVNDISFDSKNGLAYIATNKGVSIIRIPYADEKKSYQYVEIFPSPFIIPNNKPLTINGLRDNSEIKIMTLNGIVIKTIYQSEVKGYQAYWNGLDDQGNLVGSGVYLIAIYNNDSSTIEKVAVIRG